MDKDNRIRSRTNKFKALEGKTTWERRGWAGEDLEQKIKAERIDEYNKKKEVNCSVVKFDLEKCGAKQRAKCYENFANS